MHHLEKIDGSVKAILAATYPDYKGRTVLFSAKYPHELRSYWDGGSRTYYKIYSLDDGRVLDIGSNHPMFEAGKPHHIETLPARFLIVAHSFYCGKDHGITIYGNESDINPMLPAPTEELTEAEKIVLTFTRAYKNTYGGRSNIRYAEAKRVHGISGAAWMTAQKDLIEKGFLNKACSITAAGRNAIQGKEVRYS